MSVYLGITGFEEQPTHYIREGTGPNCPRCGKTITEGDWGTNDPHGANCQKKDTMIKHLPDGRIVFECPVCDEDIPIPSAPNYDPNAAISIGAALGVAPGGLEQQWLWQHAQDTEKALQDHLNRHPASVWFPILMDYKNRLEAIA